jgi:excisionase family DNA binding protein
MPDDFLTTTDAAAMLGVSDETVRRWVEAGRLRHIRLPSGQIRFRREDIEAILVPIEPTTSAS